MPSIRHIKNTSATVFFATLLLCVGVKASDISPKAPAELFGLKIESHCKDLGQPYVDLKEFLVFGSGRTDFLNTTQEKQCVAGNPSYHGGYQSEIYRRENNGRSETIELFFTPDMKLWKIDLKTTWNASDAPMRKTTIDSLLQRFGRSILIKETRSIQDNRPDEEVTQSYAARWSTRTALKKQINASIDLELCKGIEKLSCVALLSARSNSLWDPAIKQLGGIVTAVKVESVGQAERTSHLWISMQDSTVSEKYWAIVNQESKKSLKNIEEYIKKLDKEKVPNF